MKTKKRLTSIARLAIALAGLAILSGCASSGAKGPGQHRLTMTATRPDDGNAQTEFEKWRYGD